MASSFEESPAVWISVLEPELELHLSESDRKSWWKSQSLVNNGETWSGQHPGKAVLSGDPFFSTWFRRISTKIPGLPRSDPAARSAHAVGPVRRAIHVAAEGIDLRTTKCSSQLSNWMKKGSTCQNVAARHVVFRTYIYIYYTSCDVIYWYRMI